MSPHLTDLFEDATVLFMLFAGVSLIVAIVLLLIVL